MTGDKRALPSWPFLVADSLFIALAALFLWLGSRPLLWWEALLITACVALGAGCLLLLVLRRNEDEQSLAQARLLADAVRQLQQIEQVAAQIGGATSQWRENLEQTAQVGASAKALAESMSAEAKAFKEFLQQGNDAEKSRLRLEVDKLRRAESDWLQVTVCILDHVSAVFQGACRSGQQPLIEQMGQFHNNCREVVRRVGLAPMVGRKGEPFDANLHQLRDGAAAGENAIVAETLMAGYTYQGQLVRRALVTVEEKTAN
jgi:molecular chaperone GrpE (heat shock protein)